MCYFIRMNENTNDNFYLIFKSILGITFTIVFIISLFDILSTRNIEVINSSNIAVNSPDFKNLKKIKPSLKKIKLLKK